VIWYHLLVISGKDTVKRRGWRKKNKGEKGVVDPFFVYLKCEKRLVVLMLSRSLTRPAGTCVTTTAKRPKGIRRRRARGILLDLPSEAVSKSEVSEISERVQSVFPISDQTCEPLMLRIRSSLPTRISERVRLCRAGRRRIRPIRRG